MEQKLGKPALRALIDNLDPVDPAVATLLQWVEASEQVREYAETLEVGQLHNLRAAACSASASTIDGLIAKILLSHDVFGTQVHNGEFWDPADYRFEIAAAGEDEDLVSSILDALMLMRAYEGCPVESAAAGGEAVGPQIPTARTEHHRN